MTLLTILRTRIKKRLRPDNHATADVQREWQEQARQINAAQDWKTLIEAASLTEDEGIVLVSEVFKTYQNMDVF